MHFSKYNYLWLLILASGCVFSQEKEEEKKDGIKYGKINLIPPTSFVDDYTYDPLMDMYIYAPKNGGVNAKTPRYLTKKEYFKLALRHNMGQYFKRKKDITEGKKDGTSKDQRNIIPTLYVKNGLFENIFGGNEIIFTPTGTFELDLGYRSSIIDNPALSPRLRINQSPEITPRFNLGLIGKIGKLIKFTANFDSQSSFDFQRIVKLEYDTSESLGGVGKVVDDGRKLYKEGNRLVNKAKDISKNPGGQLKDKVKKELDPSTLYNPHEDNIIQKIGLGNVSMPLSNSLVKGAQQLFGVYTELQFGKTYIKGIFANQQSQTKKVQAKGNGLLNKFQFTPLNYQENQHFFLAQYFRDNYDKALENYPFINSQVQITRIEVWVTNRSQKVTNNRNIIGIQDLGEPSPEKTHIALKVPASFYNSNAVFPDNSANDYNPTGIKNGTSVLNSNVRETGTVSTAFNAPVSGLVQQGHDYDVLENARKLVQGSDFTFHPKLGYISLNQKLNNDGVLAVAFQYTYRGKVYQVGEFSNGGINATEYDKTTNKVKSNALVLKMLKSRTVNVQEPMWNLMMKNIYKTGAYKLSKDDFKLNIYYGNPSTLNYISPVDNNTWPQGLDDRLLLNLFHLDRLNVYQDTQSGGDGFFDYVDGVTVKSNSGVIIFPKVEPFGSYLHTLLGGGNYDNTSTYNDNQKRYVYSELYKDIKASSQEEQQKNKFIIKGEYKSVTGAVGSSTDGISIGAVNVARGSVRVSAKGRLLKEGIDYTVDYTAGKIHLLDQGIKNSNTPLDISVENNNIFGKQNRTFAGIDIQHKVNKDISFGMTWLNLNERPLTQKTNFGVEAVNNNIYGFNGVYSTEFPFLTRLANKIRYMESETPSKLTVKTEAAYLIANTNNVTNLNNETTSYIDDFEGSQALLNIKSPFGWSLSSVPHGLGGELQNNDLSVGYQRSKIAWYSIDPIFYNASAGASNQIGIDADAISKNSTRRVLISEIFPNQDVGQGQTRIQNTLDLAYYPDRKGPYNNNPSFSSLLPSKRWAGIMRGLQNTNFEQSNIEYVQFWVMDPYFENPDIEIDNTGELNINLGIISEDVLKDGRKQYENGLPVTVDTQLVTKTNWGKVPSTQSINYVFDNISANRKLQDVGFDGLNDKEEALTYTNNSGVDDPALDNYVSYLAATGSVLNRYIDYNNPDGNAAISISDGNRASTGTPDIEDANKDQTMNTIDSYFEYKILMKPNITTSDKFVNDIKQVSATAANGKTINSRWIQYKIPITAYDRAIGGVSNFRAVTHMRMYMKGFKSAVVMRFGTLDLVKKEWRNYTKTLETNKDDPDDDGTYVEVNAVNVQENEKRTPIPYVLPPGVSRERLQFNNSIVRNNEQSLSFKVCDLAVHDSRGIYKLVNYDFRRYKFLKIYVHAEAYRGNFVGDNDLVAFIRIGTDTSENFYQAEIPLSITAAGSTTAEQIWPSNNQIAIPFDLLTKMKTKQIKSNNTTSLVFYNEDLEEVQEFAPRKAGKIRLAIRGNPSIGSVRTIVIGVKNATTNKICGEVWFNEMRLAKQNNKGGWATTGTVDFNIADVMNLTTTSSISTIGFGGVDEKPNERNLDDTKQFSFSSNVNLHRFAPKKWGLNIPFNYTHSQKSVTPLYDKFYEDVKLEDRINDATDSGEKRTILTQSQEYTREYGINFIGVKKNKVSSESKNRPYDIENFTFNYSYNQLDGRTYQLNQKQKKTVKTEILYNYPIKPKVLQPLRKVNFFNNKYLRWLYEFNIGLLPSNISFSTDINRQFEQQKFRAITTAGVDPELLKPIPASQRRNYLFNWQYAISHDITKSLKLNVTASSNRIVRNYFLKENGVDKVDNFGNPIVNKDASVWDDYINIGDPDKLNQKVQLNYHLPIDKLPFMGFFSSDYSYTSDFQWSRGSRILRQLSGENINKIQNSNTQNLSLNLNVNRLYKIVGISRTSDDTKFVGIFKDFATMLKRINFTYTENSGTILPGYNQSINFLGTLTPTIPFVLGDQTDIRDIVTNNGWFTTYDKFNDLYKENRNYTMTFKTIVRPIDGLIIDINARRNHANTYEESFNVREVGTDAYEYLKYTSNITGNFSSTTLILGNPFEQISDKNTKVFITFKDNRLKVANRLATERGISTTATASGYPKGYGSGNQAVLVPSFITAYTNQDPATASLDPFPNIPLPNWSIKYTGLMKIEWFKEKFSRFSFNHSYVSIYTVNSFTKNLDYDQNNPDKTDINDNFINPILYNGITLSEKFSPLIKIDFETKNNFSMQGEIKRSKTLNLSLSNQMLTENNSKEYIVGFGYRFKDVKIGNLKNSGDINIKTNVSVKDNLTVIRNLQINNNKITAGSQGWTLKFTTDYSISKNANIIFYYDHSFTAQKTSRAFPLTIMRTGITFRLTF